MLAGMASAVSVSITYTLLGQNLFNSACLSLTTDEVELFCEYTKNAHGCPCDNADSAGSYELSCPTLSDAVDALTGIVEMDSATCANDGGTYYDSLSTD